MESNIFISTLKFTKDVYSIYENDYSSHFKWQHIESYSSWSGRPMMNNQLTFVDLPESRFSVSPRQPTTALLEKNSPSTTDVQSNHRLTSSLPNIPTTWPWY